MREYLTFEELQRFSIKRIDRLQQKRFQAVVRYILPLCKAYREMFREYNVDFHSVRSVEDWHKKGLPLIKKSYYIKNSKDFVAMPYKSKRELFSKHMKFVGSQSTSDWLFLWLEAIFNREGLEKQIKQYYFPKMPAFSGGTESGHPTAVFMTGKERLSNFVNNVDNMGKMIIANLPGKDIIGMNLFPYAPHMGWHAVHEAMNINADLNLCTAAGGAISTERLVDIAGKAKPNVIAGMSTYIRNKFLPMAVKSKIKLPESVVFANGATKMYPSEIEDIKRLAAKLGVKKPVILDALGASEFKEDLMPECCQGSGFHMINPLTNIIKAVKVNSVKEDSVYIDDWDFTDQEEGGYITVWNIDGAGTMLQGYLLGDHVESIVEKCPSCRLNVRRILGVERIANLETAVKLTGMIEEKIKGSRVNLSSLRETLLSIKEVEEVQLIIKKSKKKDEILIRCVPSSDRKGAIDKIKAALRRYSEVTPKIEVVSLDNLMSGDHLKYEGIVIKKENAERNS